MFACLDADYRDELVVAACVLFDGWTASQSTREVVASVSSAQDYVPGRFFERELPALVAVLDEVHEPLEAIVIDGYVWLARERPGLGFHVWDARGRSVPVIGVAKNRFAGNDAAIGVLRGASQKPLFVTAVGVSASDAAEDVRSMHGEFRIPTLLKRVDSLCRTAST